MPFVSNGDLDIYYEVHGSGRRLLVLNGSGSTIEGSRALISYLARSFEVAVHDQRGLGRTGVPKNRDPFTMAQYADDARAVLDDLSWTTTSLLGMSFGGMVAQECAVTWPARLSRLVLLCTSPGGGGGSSYPLHELEALSPSERAKAVRQIVDTRFDDAWLNEHPTDRALVDEMTRAASASRTPEEIDGSQRQLEARRGHDVWDRLSVISCPTFIGCGLFDGLAPPANSNAISSRIANSQVHSYNGGHAFALQDSRALVDVVNFLNE